MHEKSIEATYTVYDSIQDLPPEDKELLVAAKETLRNSYAPYSHFHVAAAVRLESGEVLLGTNQENAAYGQCLCAEQNVLANAGSNRSGQTIIAIAITAKHNERKLNYPVTPCGACRQVLREHEDRHDHQIRIIMQGEVGDIIAFQTVQDLLPLSFSRDDIL
ncbi:MAG: cytidine deaminase [Saprospiraceae bacterium]|nr:cytidine deaminase [Saprospiraceae bacterium]